jgi:hypothetical protein
VDTEFPPIFAGNLPKQEDAGMLGSLIFSSSLRMTAGIDRRASSLRLQTGAGPIIFCA